MVKNVRVPNVEYLENNKPETFDECFNASNIRKSQWSLQKLSHANKSWLTVYVVHKYFYILFGSSIYKIHLFKLLVLSYSVIFYSSRDLDISTSFGRPLNLVSNLCLVRMEICIVFYHPYTDHQMEDMNLLLYWFYRSMF